jgi:hypothetical protein
MKAAVQINRRNYSDAGTPGPGTGAANISRELRNKCLMFLRLGKLEEEKQNWKDAFRCYKSAMRKASLCKFICFKTQ